MNVSGLSLLTTSGGGADWRLRVALALLGAALLVRFTIALNVPAPEPRGVAPVEQSSSVWIDTLRQRIERDPANGDAYAELGLAYLRRVREGGDPSLYGRAERALDEALARDSEALNALIGQGMLALARHDFQGALAWAERARAVSPYSAEVLGIMVDAQVELGRYDEAIETAQSMVDLKPGLPSYTRVSYLRELHGNLEGAKEAMRRAVDAGVPGTEAWLWAQYQFATLYFNSGDLDRAEALYQEALRLSPTYPYARAGLARMRAARGYYGEAIATLDEVTEVLPLPEFAIALGEVLDAAGRPDEAALQYDLVAAMQQLNEEGGMNVDLEMALFAADQGEEPAKALALARHAYEARPSIHAADVLAWALYKNGQPEEAAPYIEEALRLGTRDARLYYHAGRITHARGETNAAREYLREALAINPYFSPLQAADARTLLRALERRD